MPFDETFDVIVAGLGAAGACAAIEAGRAGARVLVVEKASFDGGTTSMSGGVIYCGGGTEIQRACGFQDSAEDMRAYLMAAGGPEPDAEKVELYSQMSVDHFDWLVDLGPEGGSVSAQARKAMRVNSAALKIRHPGPVTGPG